MEQNKARLNEDGSVTTANIKSVPFNDRIYNLPSYDYETGEDMSEDQTLKKFMKNIELGEVDSYVDEESADKAAKIETFSIVQDNKSVLKAIKRFVKDLNNHKISDEVDIRLYPPRIRYRKEW